MRKNRLVGAIAAIVTLLSIGQAEKRAILIQVSQYQDPEISSFLGKADKPTRSVDNAYMRSALKRHGFTHFVELSEQQATLESIRAQLDAVRRQTQPSDVVVFYFSGHGALGRNGISLAPHDAQANSSVNDLSGSELAEWARALPTPHVVIILDCCFFSEPLANEAFVRLLPKVIRQRRPETGSWGDLARLEKGVVLTAASLREKAYQMPAGPNSSTNTYDWVGIFTLALRRVLETSGSELLNYQSLAERTAEETMRAIVHLNTSEYSQNPQIFGSQQFRATRIFASESQPSIPEESTGDPVPIPPAPQLRVYIDPSLPPDLARQVRERLQSLQAEITFTQNRFEATHIVEKRDNRIVLTNMHGSIEVVLPPTVPQIAEQLDRAVTNHAGLCTIIELYHQHFAQKSSRLRLQTDRNTYRPRDKVVVSLTPSMSGYLILLSRTPDDNLSLLFPETRSENQPLMAGENHTFPPHPDARYYFEVLPPPGVDFICAIVVQDINDHSRILEELGVQPNKSGNGEVYTPKGGVIRVRSPKALHSLLSELVKSGKCEIGYVQFRVER